MTTVKMLHRLSFYQNTSFFSAFQQPVGVALLNVPTEQKRATPAMALEL